METDTVETHRNNELFSGSALTSRPLSLVTREQLPSKRGGEKHGVCPSVRQSVYLSFCHQCIARPYSVSVIVNHSALRIISCWPRQGFLLSSKLKLPLSILADSIIITLTSGRARLLSLLLGSLYDRNNKLITALTESAGTNHTVYALST